ncbi:RNA binding motif protein 12Ba [Salminus brasiliensis]|uniref:RNA binding motif protein 12Ba n=1 Tax=Salminus brasiliensis TaxID=930266 RepID=UPI003B838471
MVVVRRLLGLSADAGSEDIRAFFHGLHIPEGGVHIIGGRRGEAFIIFTTEREGQLAMERSGELLRGSSVTLQVSSLADFKHKMESRLRKQKCSAVENRKAEAEKKKVKVEEKKKKRAELKMRKAELERKAVEPQPAPSQSPSPPDLGTALLLGLVAAIQGMQSNNSNQESQTQLPPVSTYQPPALPQSRNHASQGTAQTFPIKSKLQERVPQPIRVHEEHERGTRETKSCEPGYLRLYGLPSNVAIKEVRRFLKGLSVLDFIPNVFLGRDQCCLVKVASLEEAEEGLKYSHVDNGDSFVEVRTAYERMWTYAMEPYEHGQCSTSSELDRSSPDKCLSWTPPIKRLSEDRSLSGSPKRQRFDSPLPGQEYCVMVKNLFPQTTKTEIKALFCCAHIPNNKIVHLLNCRGQRTSTAFIMFTHPEDYATAMNMDGTPNGSKVLDVSSVTMEKMKDIMYKERLKDPPRAAPYGAQDRTVPSCIYARNFPADVQKREVKDFFCLYGVHESDVTLLRDEWGNSIGEAVIQFGSEQAARDARSLHGSMFLGQQIMLTCISPQQMKTILREPH